MTLVAENFSRYLSETAHNKNVRYWDVNEQRHRWGRLTKVFNDGTCEVINEYFTKARISWGLVEC